MFTHPARRGSWHTALRLATLCAAWAGLIGADLFAPRGGSLAAAERTVLAVVTLDSYGDLRSQLQWLGGQVGQPALAGGLESLLLMASQGRGLAGLDVKRPLGVVVTTDGNDVAVHGFVPVKNLDKLLDSLKGVTGPVEKADDVRTIMLPSGLPLAIAERDGWAILTPQGGSLDAADPTPLFKHLSDDYSLGIEVFPSRMPEPLRLTLRLLLEQALAAAANQGPPLDPRAVAVALDGLASTESLSLGIAMDPEASQMFLENRVVATPGSVGADAMRGTAEGRATVPLPPAADGGRPAIVGHIVQPVPQSAREGVLGMIDQALPPGSDDPLTATIAALLREMIRSVLATGGIDAAVSADLAGGDGVRQPAVTAGVRVQDGTLLEAAVKRAFAPGGKAAKLLPAGVVVAFDVAKEAGTNLHTIRIDLEGTEAAEQLGTTLELTLAFAPEHAYVLSGADARKRMAAVLGRAARADPAAQPIAGLQVAVDRMLAAAGQAAAARADDAGGTVRLDVRPIDRGVQTRLSIDGSGLKAAAAAAPADAGGVGLAPGLPIPNGFPIPAPAR